MPNKMEEQTVEKKDVKKGYELAEKELKEKQIEEVKNIVKATLEKIEALKDRKKDIEQEIKILKLDLENFKDGRLDLVEERQKKDKKASEVSVVKVIKEVEHHYYDRWYEPYKIYWYPSTITVQQDFTSDGTFYCNGTDTASIANSTNSGSWTTINCSIAKYASPGAYSVAGSITNFR